MNVFFFVAHEYSSDLANPLINGFVNKIANLTNSLNRNSIANACIDS